MRPSRSAAHRGSEILEQRTETHIDGIWYTIARNRMTYNAEGKRTSLDDDGNQTLDKLSAAISAALAELQSKEPRQKPRRRIGFILSEEEEK